MATGSADAAEADVLALVNEARAAAGCAPVTQDGALADLARAHSADMRDRGFFSHTDPNGQDPWARARAAGVSTARAENIARGQSDAAAVMAGWMASPGHRSNILNCSLRTLGVGVARGPGGPWWTQVLGS
ncbi:CAP domain-containing protein [Goekera deserti]|uniref:CAP domain-containing protein n=1 Tax=Goekera deserti TaxID=2497753 RepID=UPI001F1C93BD|nr:CAP domain-containing protein [Goekera deserti]